MWAELGGDKIDKKVANKKPAEKQVKVEVPVGQTVQTKKEKEVQLA